MIWTIFRPEYRRFLQIQEESRLQWQQTTAEAQRLQRELDKCCQDKADLETKLFHARRLLEMESKARRVAETDRDAIVSLKIKSVVTHEFDFRWHRVTNFMFM